MKTNSSVEFISLPSSISTPNDKDVRMFVDVRNREEFLNVIGIVGDAVGVAVLGTAVGTAVGMIVGAAVEGLGVGADAP